MQNRNSNFPSLEEPSGLTAVGRKKLLMCVELIFGAVEYQGEEPEEEDSVIIPLSVNGDLVIFHWHELFYGRILPEIVKVYSTDNGDLYAKVDQVITKSKNPIECALVICKDIRSMRNFKKEKEDKKKKIKSLVI